MRKPLEIIKNRSDIGAGTRGSDLGIDAIEIAAINKGSDFFVRHSHKDVRTRNNSVYNPEQTRYAKHIAQIYKQCKEVSNVLESCLNMHSFPLVFSGDHSSAMGTISGIKKAFPTCRLAVLWIDAHADIHSPHTTPSGNMHGMPLAAMMGMDHLDYSKNTVDLETLKYWEKLKCLGGDSPIILPTDLIYFGVRDTEQEEDNIIAELGIKNYTVESIREQGVNQILSEVAVALTNCDLIYVSFDVDSMDSELISDGTGTPVPKGLNVSEVKQLLGGIMHLEKVVCLEVVEVNPLLDHQGNKMAEVTFDILEEVLKELV